METRESCCQSCYSRISALILWLHNYHLYIKPEIKPKGTLFIKVSVLMTSSPHGIMVSHTILIVIYFFTSRSKKWMQQTHETHNKIANFTKNLSVIYTVANSDIMDSWTIVLGLVKQTLT